MMRATVCPHVPSGFFSFELELELAGFTGYILTDYPRIWPIKSGPAIKMHIEDSVRFSFANSEEAAHVWEAQIPGNGAIYLGKERQPFSIGMMHELRCLHHLRAEIVLGWSLRERNVTLPPNRLSRHCLNYLRQMVLCRADVDLEPVSTLPSKSHLRESRCNDWTTVYDAIERNQKEYTGEWNRNMFHSSS